MTRCAPGITVAAISRDGGASTTHGELSSKVKYTAPVRRTARTLGEEQLDQAAPASLYSDAPITCQFMLEDHAVRHSYHHLGRIRAALKR